MLSLTGIEAPRPVTGGPLKALLTELAESPDDGVAVSTLKPELRTVAVLSAAAVHGLIEIGRRNFVVAKLPKVTMENIAGKVTPQITDMPRMVHLEEGYSWTDLSPRPDHDPRAFKSIPAILKEDSSDPLYVEHPGLALRVRVTAKGLSALGIGE